MSKSRTKPAPAAPARSTPVLLLIDVINDFDFPASGRLLRFALPAARKIAALKKRLTKAGVPAVYVNDNFGMWQSGFEDQVRRCCEETCRGHEIARLLLPEPEDYFVLKPRHSGFYSSSLDALLAYLDAGPLILTGFAGDICVVYTANDAYMRGHALYIPRDCIASETAAGNRAALDHMASRLRADIRASRMVRMP